MVASSMSACFRVYGALAACLFLLLGNVQVQAQVYLVNPDATGTGTPRTDVVAASDWTTFAYADLQTAIAAAAYSNGQIWVKAGVYHPSVDPTGNATPTDPRDRTFLLTSGQKLYGGFAGNETSLSQRNTTVNVTTLSGDFNGDDIVSGIDTAFSITNNAENAYHVIVKKDTDGSAVVDGFVITGGNADGTTTFYSVGNSPMFRGAGSAIYAPYYAFQGHIDIKNNKFYINNKSIIHIGIAGNIICNNY